MKTTSKLLAVALLAGVPWLAGAATAAPLGHPLLQNEGLTQNEGVTQDEATPQLQQVQFRRWGGRGGWRGGGWRGSRGWWGPGLAAGIIGGLALSQPWSGYNSYDPGYAYQPYGYQPGYTGGGDDVAYCQQRFRSYDPASGTYLGYDGVRHPCP